MKAKRILILLLIMSLWGGSMLFANSAAQKVRVFINAVEVDESGILSDGKTYLPLRQIANTLQSLVVWDDSAKRASIFKPNVHMFLFQDKTVFGNVKQGSRTTFSVWAQVDNLQTDINSVKIVIADPFNKEELIQSQEVTTQRDNFWFRTEEILYKFDSSGRYSVRFYMKHTATSDWTLVSEKTITAQ